MKNSGNFRRKSALYLSSTVGIALTLAGCTSVEYAAKPELESPKVAAAPVQPEVDEAAIAAAQTGNPAPVSTTQVAATSAPALQPSGASAKGGRVALPPASEIAAAAAISAQMQPQPQAQQVALAAPAAQTATVQAASVSAKPAETAALPQVVALKGSFPPVPGAPGTPSAAAVPLTEDMMRQQSVIPLPKPTSVLAYASAPQNAALAAITTREAAITAPASPSLTGRSNLSGLITKYAAMYDVPEDLVHRVVQRESRYNPGAFNRGHFGLMQIKHATARSMGFDGPASGLFDAETNLRYAVKYLRGAWLVADNDRDGAVRLYARGYYYDAKRKGMLHVLRK